MIVVVSDSGRSSAIAELRKPAAYSVTEQSLSGVSTSSPVHHVDLTTKLPYSLCTARTALQSSPSAGVAGLRSTGRVRFLDGRLQDCGSDLTGTAHRLPPDLCDPGCPDDVACMAGSSLTTPSSILRARCLRGQHFHPSGVVDDHVPQTTSVVSPESLIFNYSND